jgi:hypothetical protein
MAQHVRLKIDASIRSAAAILSALNQKEKAIARRTICHRENRPASRAAPASLGRHALRVAGRLIDIGG